MGWQCSAGTSSEARVRWAASAGRELAVLGLWARAAPPAVQCSSTGSPWELQVPECPALHACSNRNPWRVPARAGAQESGTELQCFGLLRAVPNTLPALLVPAAGDPGRPEPCPGAASGRKNRPLYASGVGTALRVKEGAGAPEGLCLAQGHTFCCLRAMKPESRWVRGEKDDVGVGSWPCWRENGEFSWTHLP